MGSQRRRGHLPEVANSPWMVIFTMEIIAVGVLCCKCGELRGANHALPVVPSGGD